MRNIRTSDGKRETIFLILGLEILQTIFQFADI
jgi:hypothetical protein